MKVYGHEHHNCDDPWVEAQPWAIELGIILGLILAKLEAIMATLDEVLTEVTDENTRLDSIQALIDGLKQQIADALSGVTLPPAVQAKVDSVFTTLTSSKGKIDKALNVNVPPPPPPTP